MRDLLNELDYYGTRLPRLPVAVERELKAKLKDEEVVEKRASRHMEDRESMRYFETIGSRVQALYGDEENPVTWYDAVVDRVLRKEDETGIEFFRPKFVVTFPEYGNTETVTLGEMDMPGVDHSKPNPSERDYISRQDVGVARGMGYDDRHRSDRDKGRGYGRDNRGRGYDSGSRDRPGDGGRYHNNGHQHHGRSQRYGSDDRGYNRDRNRDQHRSGNRGYSDKQGHRRERSRSRDREVEAPKTKPPAKKTPEELAAIAQKKRKLMAKYG